MLEERQTKPIKYDDRNRSPKVAWEKLREETQRYFQMATEEEVKSQSEWIRKLKQSERRQWIRAEARKRKISALLWIHIRFKINNFMKHIERATKLIKETTSEKEEERIRPERKGKRSRKDTKITRNPGSRTDC